MKSILKNVLILAGLGAAIAGGIRAADTPPTGAETTPSTAPEHGHMGHMGMRENAQKRLDRLTQALALTDAQQKQVKGILEAAAGQRKAIMDEQLAEKDRWAKMRFLMEDTNTKIRTVLTPDQQQKFDAMRPMRHGRMGHPAPESDANAPTGGAPRATEGNP